MEKETPADTLLVLNDDAKAVAAKELRSLIDASRTALAGLEQGSLTTELAQTVLFIAESRLVKVCKVTGVEIDSIAERDQRFAQLRAANMRIRELESQLGAQVSPTHVKEALGRLSSKIKGWWRKQGLGHVRDVRFLLNGACEVKLSCSLRGDFSFSMSETPVSDKDRHKEWLASLQTKGFVLKKGRHSDDDVLVDCDASKAALTSMIYGAFPTARFGEVSSHWGRNGVAELREACLMITDLREIEALPESRED